MCYVIPMYNEPYCELSATLRSIAENIEVWRRSTIGRVREIDVTVVVVQDGWGACDASSKVYFNTDLGCPSASVINQIMTDERARMGADGVAVMIPEAVSSRAAY